MRQYLLVTANYWAFTLTDGALRMLVVLHFHALGYSPLQIALLFLFYEFFGVVTNLLGGWLGASLGLNKTMNVGLALQVAALSMLLVPPEALTVAWVMAAQALSGIAKDLNKMSAKSAVKLLIPDDASGRLYRWVAALTGSKNALKGAGFFLGGALLTTIGFTNAIAVMAISLSIVWILSLILLKKDIGKTKSKPGIKQLFSKSRAINLLSAARLFLFGARDVWFVVALPVFLHRALDWDHMAVGGFMASWFIAYGIVQSLAPNITGRRLQGANSGKLALFWAMALMLIPALIALAMLNGVSPTLSVVGGLMLFGVLFAINSSIHSYLIVSFARDDGVSLDVGFYYMANALGRMIGTVLSGWVSQVAGLTACLFISSLFILLAAVFTWLLAKHQEQLPNQTQ